MHAQAADGISACPAAAPLRLRPGSAQLMRPLNTQPDNVWRAGKLAYDSPLVNERTVCLMVAT